MNESTVSSPTTDESQEASGAIVRADLILRVSERIPTLPAEDVSLAVRIIIDTMSQALAEARAIEIRGFGSFSLHYYRPMLGRNPRNGEPVALGGRYMPHFRPARTLRARLRKSRAPVRG